MKKIVVKMRHLKKLIGNELLQLALMLSLLRIDPDVWLAGSYQHGIQDNYDSSDFSGAEQQLYTDDVWTQTRFGDDFALGGIGGDMSPRLHPKSVDALLDRFQDEILDDLNSLGRYNRIASFGGVPVEISAYIVNTESSGPGCSSSNSGREHLDSDSGISDTDLPASTCGSDDSESEKEDERNPSPVALSEDLPPLGLEEVVLPSPLPFLGEDGIDPDLVQVDPGSVLLDEEVLESHLLQIDDQLITIDENLDELSDEFLHLDEQLAAHINGEEDDTFVEELLEGHVDLDLDAAEQQVEFDTSPFDEWQREANMGLDEFTHLSSDLFTEPEKEKEIQENGAFQAEDALKVEESQFQQLPEQADLPSPRMTTTASEEQSEAAGAAAATGGAAGTSGSQWTAGDGKFEQASRIKVPSEGQQEPPRSVNSEIKREDEDDSTEDDGPSNTEADRQQRLKRTDKWKMNLEDLFGPSNQPEGLLRNVSMSQAQFNESLAAAATSSFASSTTADYENQTSIDGFSLPNNEADLMKELSRMLGSRETHDVETEFDALLKQADAAAAAATGAFLRSNGSAGYHPEEAAAAAPAAQGQAQPQVEVATNGSNPFDSGWARNAPEQLDNSMSSSFTNNTSVATTPGAANDEVSSPSSATPAAATSFASGSQYLPPPGLYPGYMPPGGSSGRFNGPSSVPYSHLMNHSYASPAPGMPSPLAAALDKEDTSSVKSGRSSRSRQYSVDSTTIKEDPDAADFKLRQSRDEKKALELGIPFSIQDIVNLPMDEFNDMLSRHELNEEQLNLCRDIRRRGKNKVAAQNCRKRKIDQITQLSQQVQETRLRKQQLLAERETLFRERDEWTNKLIRLQEDVLFAMNKNGHEWALDLDGASVSVVRRSSIAAGGGNVDQQMAMVYQAQAQRGTNGASSSSSSSTFATQNRSIWKRGSRNS